jgi:hypothetical protein
MFFSVLGLGAFLSGLSCFSGAGGLDSCAGGLAVSGAGGFDAAFGSCGEEGWF